MADQEHLPFYTQTPNVRGCWTARDKAISHVGTYTEL